MEEKTYLIYKATSPSGKVYIGQTRLKLKDRKNSHHSYARKKPESVFHKALIKYNFQFSWEIVEIAYSKEEIDFLEKYYIKFYQSVDRNFGYNMDSGGFGGCLMTDEGKKRYKEKMQKHWDNPEYKKKCIERIEKNRHLLVDAKRKKAGTREYSIIASRNAGGKPFKCHELNLIFETRNEAAKYFNCSKASIYRVLSGEQKQLFKKYTFSII